jgi:hypothetical protein
VFLAEGDSQLRAGEQELLAACRLGLASAGLFGARALGSFYFLRPWK